MSQLIPPYITGPFAPGVKSRGEAQSSSQSVCIVMSPIRLKVKACNSRQCMDGNHYRDQCVEIGRRHHLTLHWVLTLPPLGCDTNKSESKRGCYPWSSLLVVVSFAGSE